MQSHLLHLLAVLVLYCVCTLGAPTVAPVTVVPLGSNLSQVIASAVPGESFILDAGSYSISERIIVSVPIKISSFGATIICIDTLGLESSESLEMNSITVTGCLIAVSLTSKISTTSKFSNCVFDINPIGIDSIAPVYVSNCTFTRNGCALRITNSSATVERSTFAYNIASARASAIVAQNGFLQLENTSFYGNQGSNGGAIFASDTTTNLTYVTAYQNNATNGGFAYLTGSLSSTFFAVNFTNNIASQNGGAVYTNAGLSFYNSQLLRNNAGVNGGAIFVISQSVLLVGTYFTNNTAVVNGGAVYYDSVGWACDIVATTFTSNSADTGGAIYMTQSFVLTLGSNFFRNIATTGGAVYASSATTFVMNTGYANDNRATYGGVMALAAQSYASIVRMNSSRNAAGGDGGAYYIDNSRVNFRDVTMDNNTAQGSGGGVYASLSTPVITNVDFVNHYAGLRGGAVYATGGNISINVSTVSSNTANNEGGAIALAGVSVANFSNMNFTSNRAFNNGGAVSINAGGAVAFANTQFVANTATNSGGAVYALQGFVSFGNSLLTGNSANFGGAMRAIQSNVSHVSSIMKQNNASTGGAFQFLQSPSYLSNCTISQNTANTLGAIFVQGSFFEITFSNISNNFGGVYVNNVTSLSLLANSIIEANSAVGSSGIISISDNKLFHIRNSLINTNLSSLVFCCNGNKLTNPQGAYCNYPACDGQCIEAKGCSCPFVSPPLVIATPVLPSSYSNCTCLNATIQENLCLVPGRCPFGFNQNGSNGCTAINECLSPTACDSRTNCTNTPAGYSCSSCPLGFVGDPRAECRSLCGDGVCDSTVGENCVTCTSDCKQVTCGACGDGVCDTGETCSSCYADCGSCKAPTCENGCSSHGTCVNGVCQCTGSWTGPTCSTNNQPIEFEPNKTTPIAGGSVRTVLFSVAVRSLIERDASGAIISQLGLDPREHNFTFVETPLFGSSSNTMWTYSTVLSNSAIVNITFISFQETSTQYTFANKTAAYSANTLKVNLRVSQWPFRAISNYLQVAMETDAKGGEEETGCVPVTSASTDAEGNLLWVKVTVNSVAFYGQFVPYSVIDGRTRSVQFSLNSNDKTDKMVYATLPHFWQSAEFDPSYTVLIDPTDQTASCGKKKKTNKTLIIAVAASVAGAALILGAVAFFVLLRRRKITTDRLEMKSKRSNTAM